MQFYPSKPGDYIYVKVGKEEMAALVQEFSITVEDLGTIDSSPSPLVSPIHANTTVTLGATAEDAVRPHSPKHRMSRIVKGNTPSQIDVLRFVTKHAKDQDSSLFQPWLYDKAGVFARRVAKDTTVSVRPPATRAKVEFKFFSPWKDDNGNSCQEAVSRGDYLSLITKPALKADGTPHMLEGEVYRIEGTAFEDDQGRQVLNRFTQICATCRLPCDECSDDDACDGPHPYLL